MLPAASRRVTARNDISFSFAKFQSSRVVETSHCLCSAYAKFADTVTIGFGLIELGIRLAECMRTGSSDRALFRQAKLLRVMQSEKSRQIRCFFPAQKIPKMNLIIFAQSLDYHLTNAFVVDVFSFLVKFKLRVD